MNFRIDFCHHQVAISGIDNYDLLKYLPKTGELVQQILKLVPEGEHIVVHKTETNFLKIKHLRLDGIDRVRELHIGGADMRLIFEYINDELEKLIEVNNEIRKSNIT